MVTISNVTFFVTAALGCWFFLRLLRHGSGPLLINRSPVTRWGLLDVLGFFVAWIAAQSLIAAALNPAGKPMSELSPEEQGTLLLFAFLGATAISLLAAAVIFWRRHHRWQEFGFSRGWLRSGLWVGFAAFTMFAPPVWLLHLALERFVSYEHQSLTLVNANPSWWVVAQVWVTAVICAPIMEELFFRCILLGWLQRVRQGGLKAFEQLVLGDRDDEQALERRQSSKGTSSPGAWTWAPLVVSSALFAAMHLGQGAAPIPLFLFGLCLAGLYQCTGSVLACIVTHMILNLFGVFSFTFQAT